MADARDKSSDAGLDPISQNIGTILGGLLTEQKTTKLIDLMEEMRRDLPMVKDRHDPNAAALQQPTDPQQVLAAIDERRET